jgi:hypothetical protein
MQLTLERGSVRVRKPSACLRAKLLRQHGTHFTVRKSLDRHVLVSSAPSACHVPRLSGLALRACPAQRCDMDASHCERGPARQRRRAAPAESTATTAALLVRVPPKNKFDV